MDTSQKMASFRRPKNTNSDGDCAEEGKKSSQISLESDSLPECASSTVNRKKKLLKKKRSSFMDVDLLSKPSSSKAEQMEVDLDGFESQISSSEDERPGDCEADDEQSDWVGYAANDPELFNPADRKARKNRQLKLELSQLEKRLERFALSKNDAEMGLEFKIKDRPNSAHLHRLLLHYRLEVVKRQRGNVVLRKKTNTCDSVPECE